MKYLLRNGKTEYIGNKKQCIEYVRQKYKDDYFVQEYSKVFDLDFGKFKFTLECLGLELADKMSDKEYEKTHRRKSNARNKR